MVARGIFVIDVANMSMRTMYASNKQAMLALSSGWHCVYFRDCLALGQFILQTAESSVAWQKNATCAFPMRELVCFSAKFSLFEVSVQSSTSIEEDIVETHPNEV